MILFLQGPSPPPDRRLCLDFFQGLDLSAFPLHLITSCLQAGLGRVKGLVCLSMFRAENVCALSSVLLPALLSSELGGDGILPNQLSYLKAIELGEVFGWCVIGWGDDSSLQWFVGSSLPQARVSADETWAQLRHTRFFGGIHQRFAEASLSCCREITTLWREPKGGAVTAKKEQKNCIPISSGLLIR